MWLTMVSLISLVCVIVLIQAIGIDSQETSTTLTSVNESITTENPLRAKIKKRYTQKTEEEWEQMLKHKQECRNAFYKDFAKSKLIVRQCCMQTYVNNCLEQKCKLSLPCSFLLEATTEQHCLEYLEDTQHMCKVDTKLFGAKMAGYSRSFIKVQYHLNINYDWKNHKKGGNDTEMESKRYCCFKRDVCAEYDSNEKSTCLSLEAGDSLDANINDYCECLKIYPFDEEACDQHWKSCTKAPTVIEIDDPPYFIYFLLIMVGINYFIYFYCCYDDSEI